MKNLTATEKDESPRVTINKNGANVHEEKKVPNLGEETKKLTNRKAPNVNEETKNPTNEKKQMGMKKIKNLINEKYNLDEETKNEYERKNKDIYCTVTTMKANYR